jgi:hypothetical protein
MSTYTLDRITELLADLPESEIPLLLRRIADRISPRLDFTPSQPSPHFTLTAAELATLKSGRKIATIKLVRERLRCGLVEAKDLVIRYEAATKPDL